jgi:hypothetical protein
MTTMTKMIAIATLFAALSTPALAEWVDAESNPANSGRYIEGIAPGPVYQKPAARSQTSRVPATEAYGSVPSFGAPAGNTQRRTHQGPSHGEMLWMERASKPDF